MLDLEKTRIPASLKFRVMFFLGGTMHSVFIILFAVLGILPLIIFNIGSVSLYILGGFFCINKKNGKVRIPWLVLFFSEVLVHSSLCTVLIGWQSGFSCYTIMTMAVAAYVMFTLVDLKSYLKCMAPIVAVTVIVNTLTMLYMWDRSPVYAQPEKTTLWISYLGFFFCIAIILGFTLLFILEIVDLLGKLREANKRLEYTAKHDELTGLVNRHSLSAVYEELEKAESYCVALGDIDDFKKINDTFGHSCGDIVLKTVAETIENGIGENDTACRWGGEEILIIMKGTREACLEKIEAVRAAIFAIKTRYNGMEVRVSMTFGFADHTESAKGIEALTSKADDRLYIGKRSGKNVVISEN